MARVFSVPKYLNAVDNKILAAAAALKDAEYFSVLAEGLKRSDTFSHSKLAAAIGRRSSVSFGSEPLSAPTDDEDLYGIAADLISRPVRVSVMKEQRATIIELFKNADKIYTANTAFYALIAKIGQAEIDYEVLTSTSHRWAIAKATTIISFCNLHNLNSVGDLLTLTNKLEAVTTAHYTHDLTTKIGYFFEYLNEHVHPVVCRRDNQAAAAVGRRVRYWADHIRNLHARKPIDRFKAPKHHFAKFRGINAVYNFAGTFIIVADRTLFITDPNHMADWAELADSWLTVGTAARDYRVIGVEHPISIGNEVIDGAKWIINQCIRFFSGENCGMITHLARHMHVAWYRLVAAMGDEKDAEQDKALAIEMANAFTAAPDWYDFVSNMDLCERTKLEIAKLYHLLPAADGDSAVVFKSITAVMNRPKHVDRSAQKRFLNFVASYDFCMYTTTHKGPPRYATQEGYVAETKDWYRNCIAGVFTLPPISEWGKAKIFGHFTYVPLSNLYHLNAKDVTHICADSFDEKHSMYARTEDRYENSIKHNELLWHLANGEKLSTGRTVREARELVKQDKYHRTPLVVMALKSENTKLTSNQRETWSADDEFRVLQAEIDKNTQWCASMCRGASIRISDHKAARLTHKMCKITREANAAILYSTDVSKFSPNEDRELFRLFLRYCIEATDKPKMAGFETVWDRFYAIETKSYHLNEEMIKDGSFQGFPGTQDTAMHGHIILYAVYTAREAGILLPNESAFLSVLIDDAAVVIEFSATRSHSERKEVRDAFAQHMKETYAGLGFDLDMVKTIISGRKFIYLNKLYLDGSEVFHSLKTTMKIAPTREIRFASVFDLTQSIFAAVRGAVTAGADPLAAYAIGLIKSLKLIAKRYPRAARALDEDLSWLACAPKYVGGLGFPNILEILTSDAADKLTEWVSNMWTIAAMLKKGFPDAAGTKEFMALLSNYLGTIKTLEFDHAGPLGFIANPWAIRYKGMVEHQSIIRSAIKEIAPEIVKGEPYTTIFNMHYDESLSAGVEAILKTSHLPAAVVAYLGQILPCAFEGNVTAKITRTNALLGLINRRVASRLKREIYNTDDVHLRFWSTHKNSGLYNVDQFINEGPTVFVCLLREAYYASQGYQIFDHTMPPVLGCMARAKIEYNADMRLMSNDIIEFNYGSLKYTHGSKDANLYDAFCAAGGYLSFKSDSKSFTESANLFRYNPIARMITEGLAMCAWLEARNIDASALRLLVVRAWDSEADPTQAFYATHAEDFNVKRLTAFLGGVNHQIIAFRNTQGAVFVRAAKTLEYIKKGNTMNDPGATLNAFRAQGLFLMAVEMALGKRYAGFVYAPLVTGRLESEHSTIYASYDHNAIETIHAVNGFSRVGGSIGWEIKKILVKGGIKALLKSLTAMANGVMMELIHASTEEELDSAIASATKLSPDAVTDYYPPLTSTTMQSLQAEIIASAVDVDITGDFLESRLPRGDYIPVLRGVRNISYDVSMALNLVLYRQIGEATFGKIIREIARNKYHDIEESVKQVLGDIHISPVEIWAFVDRLNGYYAPDALIKEIINYFHDRKIYIEMHLKNPKDQINAISRTISMRKVLRTWICALILRGDSPLKQGADEYEAENASMESVEQRKAILERRYQMVSSDYSVRTGYTHKGDSKFISEFFAHYRVPNDVLPHLGEIFRCLSIAFAVRVRKDPPRLGLPPETSRAAAKLTAMAQISHLTASCNISESDASSIVDATSSILDWLFDDLKGGKRSRKRKIVDARTYDKSDLAIAYRVTFERNAETFASGSFVLSPEAKEFIATLPVAIEAKDDEITEVIVQPAVNVAQAAEVDWMADLAAAYDQDDIEAIAEIEDRLVELGLDSVIEAFHESRNVREDNHDTDEFKTIWVMRVMECLMGSTTDWAARIESAILNLHIKGASNAVDESADIIKYLNWLFMVNKYIDEFTQRANRSGALTIYPKNFAEETRINVPSGITPSSTMPVSPYDFEELIHIGCIARLLRANDITNIRTGTTWANIRAIVGYESDGYAASFGLEVYMEDEVAMEEAEAARYAATEIEDRPEVSIGMEAEAEEENKVEEVKSTVPAIPDAMAALNAMMGLMNFGGPAVSYQADVTGRIDWENSEVDYWINYRDYEVSESVLGSDTVKLLKVHITGGSFLGFAIPPKHPKDNIDAYIDGASHAFMGRLVSVMDDVIGDGTEYASPAGCGSHLALSAMLAPRVTQNAYVTAVPNSGWAINPFIAYDADTEEVSDAEDFNEALVSALYLGIYARNTGQIDKLSVVNMRAIAASIATLRLGLIDPDAFGEDQAENFDLAIAIAETHVQKTNPDAVGDLFGYVSASGVMDRLVLSTNLIERV